MLLEIGVHYILVVACPTVVEESVKCETQVRGGEADEVEIAKEQENLCGDGAEAEATLTGQGGLCV